MRRMLMVAVAVSAFVAQVPTSGSGPGDDMWGKLAATNDLELKGNSPFHLWMSFQLFDLGGKTEGTGTFEEWWAAPGTARSEVHMAGLNEDGTAPAGASSVLRRDAYLVSLLRLAVLRPVTGEQPAETLKPKTRLFGKVSLACFTRKLGPLSGEQGAEESLCMNPASNAVRAVFGPGEVMTSFRNSMGKFHDTYVSLMPTITFFGQEAISGKVTTLQGFDPAKSDVKLSAPVSDAELPSGGVIAGKRIQSVQPYYPASAKVRRLSGRVLLHALIGKDGSIQSLEPIASTDPVFVDSATTAVHDWKYSPYLLNGAPTAVDTTITVNFALH
jgi:TonB family protein